MPQITRHKARKKGFLITLNNRLYARRIRDGYPNAENVLRTIMDELNRSIRIYRDNIQYYRDTLRIILLDLFYTHTLNEYACIGYSKNRNDYRSGSYYANIFLRYDVTRKVVKFLSDNDYVFDIKGSYDRSGSGNSYSARLKATDKLIGLFRTHSVHAKMIETEQQIDKIKLNCRNDRGNQVETPYEETDITLLMKEDLKLINSLLVRTPILLAISDADLSALGDRLSDHQNRSRRQLIDFRRTAVTRVFNEDFEHGGRFYRGWWENIPKEYRKYITIEDEPTVELDYAGLHINMLYAKEGLQLPRTDVYILDGIDSHNPMVRKVIKKLFLALVNAGTQEIAISAIYQEAAYSIFQNDEEQFSIPDEARDLRRLTDKILERHHGIAKYLGSGVGIKLQYEDSCMANRILTTLASRQIPCLPLHDSFIVKLKHRQELLNEMNNAFYERYNQKCEVKPDESFWEELINKKGREAMAKVKTFSRLCERYPRKYAKIKYKTYFNFFS